MDRQNILSKFIHDHNLVQQYEGIKSLIKENSLNKINSISRDLNLEEKQEIERLKELCTREV